MGINMTVIAHDMKLKDVKTGDIFAFSDDGNSNVWMKTDRREQKNDVVVVFCVQLETGRADWFGQHACVVPRFGDITIRSWPGDD